MEEKITKSPYIPCLHVRPTRLEHGSLCVVLGVPPDCLLWKKLACNSNSSLKDFCKPLGPFMDVSELGCT